MARYQIPPDPRQDDSTTPHANKVSGHSARSSPPWLWIGLGAIVTVLAVAVAVLWARLLLDVKPADISATPTAILRTAVPTSTPPAPTADSVAPVATARTDPPSEPTTSGEPTATPAGAIAAGARVVVAGTGGAGVSLRAGPGTDNARLGLANDGDILEIISGPEEGGDFVWWFVRVVEDGTEAWVVEDYLQAP